MITLKNRSNWRESRENKGLERKGRWEFSKGWEVGEIGGNYVILQSKKGQREEATKKGARTSSSLEVWLSYWGA